MRLTHAEIVDLTSSTMPQLDLHGEFAREAAIAVYGYVTRMASSGESCCRIVHGKGTGVLQQVVTRELDELLEQGVIEASFQSQKYPGAAVVVVFPPSR